MGGEHGGRGEEADCSPSVSQQMLFKKAEVSFAKFSPAFTQSFASKVLQLVTCLNIYYLISSLQHLNVVTLFL